MAKKKASPKNGVEKKAKKGPKQGTLTGMEDRALSELESKAEEYAEVRDERMQLTEREGELNDDLLALMKKHKKAEYHHGEVHCWVKATDEKVKVKIGEITTKQKRAESAGVSTTAKLDSEEESEETPEMEEMGNSEPAVAEG
jgi:glutamyl/glutaminyl-tRNA synthetase